MRISILLLLFTFATSLSANDIVIQLGVFNEPVDSRIYFKNIPNVKMMKDGSGFYLYYVEGIKNQNEASSKVATYSQLGYRARIIDMEGVLACKNACSAPSSSQPYNYEPQLTEAFTPKEISDYEKIRTVMINHPNCSVVLDGQARKLQCYLNMRGISNCRMTIKNTLSSNAVKVWLYDDMNIALNIIEEFKRIVG